MDKSKREKDKLYEIACTNQKDYYILNKCNNDSYFIKRDDDVYIKEYGFESLPDLKEELNRMWDQDEIMQNCIQPVLAAVFKLKPKGKMEDKESSKELPHTEKREEKLPPFIYNF